MSDLDQLIVSNQKLLAIQLIREKSCCDIADAVATLSKRYRELRESSPQLFACSEEDYWAGFYS